VADERPRGDPEFGPRGYLPERAAKRARKIVLRAPLGMQWIVASVVAGIVVVVAGVLLLTRGGAPGPPFVAVGPVDEVAGQVVFDDELELLLVGLGGRVRAFDAPEGVAYCEDSRRLESADGEVWSLTGRGTGGTGSFPEHPTVTADGVLYVDPSVATSPPTPSADTVPPGCS
jgi:hypothetical protein